VHRIARAIAAGVLVFALTHTALGADINTLMRLCKKTRNGDPAALLQLKSLEVYPDAELPYITRGEIFVGMSEGGAVCALGPAEHISTTHTSSGEHIQAVYPEGRKVRYVYVDNGIVTAWQE
jgi:hypothetical protein